MAMAWEERVGIVRKHFEKKGYRVHSGLQFGCELVLYADIPERVHSDFCVHVVGEDLNLNWRTMQTLARSMSDFHKTLILVCVRQMEDGEYVVEELALATEHAPFRHRQTVEVGGQRKKARTEETSEDKTSSIEKQNGKDGLPAQEDAALQMEDTQTGAQNPE